MGDFMFDLNTATVLSAWGTIASAVVAIIGLGISVFIHKNQKILTKQINDSQILLTTKINDSQQLLAQRQLIVPLWDYISDLNEIDPLQPVTPDIVKAVNTLELVALCCEGGMIDEKIIKRTFSDNYMSMYRAIESCNIVPGLSKSGKQLLLDSKATSLFYEKLKNEHLNSNAI
ncbi:hypothetical protein NP603_08420 [Methylomonas sp. SURF-1]|uniref:DUF4760 domain-containing protein n=1 Tax=Methylomonas aurea TaxID=2952224 RepID=A0ABT1UHG0_9GAMM|nr:hypothetical protein [Methylomonas sp. SURF-1]MCQ8181130.1 hypothetical protein [Methylomonas sp. SURF-1]